MAALSAEDDGCEALLNNSDPCEVLFENVPDDLIRRLVIEGYKLGFVQFFGIKQVLENYF